MGPTSTLLALAFASDMEDLSETCVPDLEEVGGLTENQLIVHLVFVAVKAVSYNETRYCIP